MLTLICGLVSSKIFLEGNPTFGEMPSESFLRSGPKSPTSCCKPESAGYSVLTVANCTPEGYPLLNFNFSLSPVIFFNVWIVISFMLENHELFSSSIIIGWGSFNDGLKSALEFSLNLLVILVFSVGLTRHSGALIPFPLSIFLSFRGILK
jgi:hypothetical protein